MPKTVPVVSTFIEGSASVHLQVLAKAKKREVLDRVESCIKTELESKYRTRCGKLESQVDPSFDDGETAGGYLSRTNQAQITIWTHSLLQEEQVDPSVRDGPVESVKVKTLGIAAGIGGLDEEEGTKVGSGGEIGLVGPKRKSRSKKSKKKRVGGQEGATGMIGTADDETRSVGVTPSGSSSGVGWGGRDEDLLAVVRRLEMLEKELAVTRGEAAAARGEAAAARGEAAAANKRAEGAEKQAEAAKGDAEAAKGEAKAAKGEADAAKGEADAAKGEAEAATNRVVEVEDDNRLLKGRMTLVESEYNDISKRMGKVEYVHLGIIARSIMDEVCTKLATQLQLRFDPSMSPVDRRLLIRQQLDSELDITCWPENLRTLAHPIHRDQIYSYDGRPRLRLRGDKAAHTTAYDADDVSALIWNLQDCGDQAYIRLAVKVVRPDLKLREEVGENE